MDGEGIDVGGLEQVGAETVETSQQVDPKQEDREYSQWIKSLKEDGDAAKFHRRLKDDYGRVQELRRLDPKGLEGVRERYSALDGIAHGDKKGLDAVQSMRSALAETQAVVEAITSGNPDAIRELPDEQREGVLRQAPAILDMLAEHSGEAYSAALLPHFVGALKESEMAGAFNQMVAVLQEQPPKWLTPEQKGAWMEDKFGKIVANATTMSQWFKAQDARLKEIGTASKQNGQGKVEESRNGQSGTFSQTANPQFWDNLAKTETNPYVEQEFEKELKPWADKLAKVGIRLSKEKRDSLGEEYVRRVSSLSIKNTEYKDQMARYNRQKSPDTSSVLSLFKSEHGKHSPTVLKSLIERDYGQVLNKQGKVTAISSNGAGKNPPPQDGVKVVSVRPPDHLINKPKTPRDWIYQNKWRMKDGSIVQVRAN
jgi:hypothetical protein